MYTIRWDHNTRVAVSSFTLTKKVLGSTIFESLTSVPFSVSGPNYDRRSAQFYYVDTLAEPGDTIKISPIGTGEDVEPTYFVVPPATSERCLLVGYVFDVSGAPLEGVTVYATSVGSHRNQLFDSSAGLVGSGRHNVVLAQTALVTATDEHGMWQHRLLRKTPGAILIPSLALGRAFYTPDQEGPVNWLDIQEMVSADFSMFWPEARGLPLNIPVA